MSTPQKFQKFHETWETRKGKVEKVAVRDANTGRFHGSTNFPDAKPQREER